MKYKMKQNKKTLLTIILIFAAALPMFAEKIVFSANKMTGQAGNSNTTTTLSGNSYIKTSSMEIQADDIELSGDDYRYIKATGNVNGKNLEANMDFTCNSLEYDRTTKIAELKGDVKLIDNDNDVKADAQIIVYDQDAEIAVLQVKINLTQKDNVCSGSYAVYYKKTQLLELSGNAQVKQKEDVFRAQYITLDMDTQDITLGGNVKGKVTESKKEEKKETEEPAEAQAAEAEDESETEESQESENSEEGAVEE